MKVVLITGCSTGIGLTTAVLLAKNKYKVYGTMRDLSKKDNLKNAKKANAKLEIKQLDVTDETSIKKIVKEIIKKEGRINVLINNAGYGLRGTVETITLEEAKQQFETNVFGVIRVTQEVLPYMRKQKSGHIINISSLAGLRGLPCNDLYCASKFALEGLSESMASTLSLWNIKVTLIEPGPVSTDFLNRSLKHGKRFDGKENPYNEILEKTMKTLEERFKNAQEAEDVAQLIKEVIESKKPQFRYQTSEEGKKIAALKFKDITGDSLIEVARQQLIKSLES